jgi:hypothetical protein
MYIKSNVKKIITQACINTKSILRNTQDYINGRKANTGWELYVDSSPWRVLIEQ